VMQIRLLAKALRLASGEVKLGTVVIAFDPKGRGPEAGIRQLMDRYQRRLRLLSPLSFELRMPQPDWPALFPDLNQALQTLAGL